MVLLKSSISICNISLSSFNLLFTPYKYRKPPILGVENKTDQRNGERGTLLFMTVIDNYHKYLCEKLEKR